MQVLVGKIVNTYGIKGAVKVYSHTDFAAKRYKKGNKVFLVHPETQEKCELTIQSYFKNKNVDIISFAEYHDINEVLPLMQWEIHVQADKKDLPEDMFYYGDLINCAVFYKDKCVGEVIDIIDIGIQQNLKIQKENKKPFFYPFIGQFLEEVDVENKKIYLNPIQGMIEDED